MSTLFLSFSKHWRNPAFEQTAFGPVWRLGWMTLGVSPHELTDWIVSWHGMLRAALKKDDQASSKGQQS